MGAKDSKRSACLCYEDAVKRMSDIEYKRICEAFKRLAGPNALLLGKPAFIQNVLGDGVPSVIAEWLYGACGGSAKGISQRDLICGLVLLTRGTEEEKVRFLWSLYSYDGYNGWIQRVELEKALRLEGAEPRVLQQTIGALFRQDQPDRVGYDQFRAFLGFNREATVLSRWLLVCLNPVPDGVHNGSTSSSSSIPTFYQSLAGVTHLHERDIADLEKAFWAVQAQSSTSQLDRAALVALVSPPVPANMCQGLFAALDENQDGHVDFKELCCGISAACRGPKAERMKFCFKIFDMDRDNQLNPAELDHLHRCLAFITTNYQKNGNALPGQLLTNTESGAGSMSNLHIDGALSLQDFLVWAIQQEETIDPLLQLLFEVGHVSIGLRPQCRHLERDIVLGWRQREKERGYRVGQYWYLIAGEWWSNWQAYTGTTAGNHMCPECGRSNQPLAEESNYGGSSASSNQSTSTDSMGDLLLLRGGGGHNTNNNNSVDTSSLGSSSGVSSSSNQHVSATSSAPGPIDNSPLIGAAPAAVAAVPTLTGEGGRLRTDVTLCEGRDFILVPDSLWKAMAMWYGGSLPLPRQVIAPPEAAHPELELYPLNLRILRHQQTPQAGSSPIIGETKAPGRYLAHTAAFSRLATASQVAEFLAAPLQRRPDEVRLWLVRPSSSGASEALVAMEADDDVDEVTLHELGVKDGDQLLLEVRNADLTWPEELGALAQANKAAQGTGTLIDSRRATIGGNLPAGATGLHNLGNTCFMNAALQTLSNTPPLTLYFLRNTHLSELNPHNPMGSRGQVARRYAELIQQLWATPPSPSHARSVAPLKLRWCVSRYAPDTLGGGGQHDSQELLAWLLDQLHEDLNRVQGEKKVYRELEDSGGRPDEEVAAEAWRLHSARDASIITDLFYGQLKSKVTCESCKHESVRFDAFNVLSLPLPMENYTLCEVLVLRQCQRQSQSQHSSPLKYGVRLPLRHGAARVGRLKRHLQRLCGVPASRLVLAQLAHAQIHQLLRDDECLPPPTVPPPPPQHASHKRAMSGVELVAFELPSQAPSPWPSPGGARGSGGDSDSGEAEPEPQSELATSGGDAAARGRQVLVRSPTEVRAPSSALCMPNILCFKTTVTVGGVASRPASLLQPPPRPFTDQPNSIPPAPRGNATLPHFLIAVHRKTLRQETYFLHQQRSKPSLFGMPMLLACSPATTTGQDLYEDVWRQVARLLSPLPPEGSGAGGGAHCNHATDCDDSLGYEFPFTLRAVLPGGQICALCHWTNFCRGCAIPSCPDTKLRDLCALSPVAELVVAVDWDPTALHLRYQAGREREYVEHESLAEARRLHVEPVDLDHCLRAFTQEERLEAKYYCSGCKSKQAATKKLQIWRLPPVLIVHLKRFDRATCPDGDVSKWVKTHKVVNFPFEGFDPTAYLAAVPQQTILRHRQLQGAGAAEQLASGEVAAQQLASSRSARERLESTSLQRTPIQDEHLHDYHQHHLQPGRDAFDLAYRLYAVVAHSGQMSGGHYVSYAHNPNGHWYCYNDSSCREVALDHLRASVDPSAAYLLFYERTGLDYRPYLPDLPDLEHVAATPLADEGGAAADSDPPSAAQEATADGAGADHSDTRRQFCRLQ